MVKVSLPGLTGTSMLESGNKGCLSFKERSNLFSILSTLRSDRHNIYPNDINCME